MISLVSRISERSPGTQDALQLSQLLALLEKPALVPQERVLLAYWARAVLVTLCLGSGVHSVGLALPDFPFSRVIIPEVQKAIYDANPLQMANQSLYVPKSSPPQSELPWAGLLHRSDDVYMTVASKER